MNDKKVIKQILKEGNQETITRIAVFDFDGTLFSTPLPDVGRVTYQEKTGKPWPHKGWWGRAESLDSEIFDIPPIPSVIAAYKEESTNPTTLMVMLTGRIPRLSREVEAILNANNLRFDKYLYNMGGATLDAKIKSLNKLMVEYPNVISITMFEDRIEHIEAFKAWGAQQDDVDFNITLVEGNHHN